jgi:hypothetical protein
MVDWIPYGGYMEPESEKGKIGVTHYEDTLNARFMTPESIARSFVPISAFYQLIHPTNSVLLGPRGCGKTTLLKMLTNRALRTWDKERAPFYQGIPIRMPDFEAVYIPSDVRWAYEISSLRESSITKLIQRAMISLSFFVAFIDTMKGLVDDDIEREMNLCSALIDEFSFVRTVPNFFDLRNTLSRIMANIRGGLNFLPSEPTYLQQVLDSLPKSFFGHSLDLPAQCCRIALHSVPNVCKSGNWALCYDELEIAPDWLKTELFESMRSTTDQNMFLKLTWSPILPSDVRTTPQSPDDFTPIRLWQSHTRDAREFCDQLATMFLRNRLQDQWVTPSIFFRKGSIVHDESDISISPYEQGGSVYLSIIELAERDKSFRELLLSHNISPIDPYSPLPQIRDTFLRKIAPLVLLRQAFTKPSGLRSRKATTIYSGETVVYAMSEANPRWLLALLNDLLDRWQSRPTFDKNQRPIMLPLVQGKTLNNAARRFASYLSTVAINTGEPDNERYSLMDILNKIGDALKYEFLERSPLPIDPPGSFTITADSSKLVMKAVDQAVLLGALVFVGQSDQAVPNTIIDQRFRLTYMLAPLYKLPLRNYKSVVLRKLLEGDIEYKQLDLFNKT